jgi:hypothetical protein
MPQVLNSLFFQNTCHLGAKWPARCHLWVGALPTLSCLLPRSDLLQVQGIQIQLGRKFLDQARDLEGQVSGALGPPEQSLFLLVSISLCTGLAQVLSQALSTQGRDGPGLMSQPASLPAIPRGRRGEFSTPRWEKP